MAHRQGAMARRGRWWIPVLIVAVVLVIGVVTWLMLRPDKEPEATPNVPEAIASASCPKGGKHDIQLVTTQAECTLRGCTTGTCQKCGYTYMSDMISALGHQWGEPLFVKPLSCTEDGLQTESCSRCGLTREIPIPHSGHGYEEASVQGDSVEYICKICGDKITLGTDEQLPQVLKEKAYRPDCSDDFTFLVSCDQEEDYLRDHLTLTGENGTVSYRATVEEDGLYRIAAAHPYQQYETYFVQLSGDLALPEYKAKSLEFRITGPDRAEVEFNKDNLIFLKTLEMEEYGSSGQYELQWDEAARRYYLTLFRMERVDPALIGKVIGIGDCTSIEEVLADRTKKLQFAKLETVSHNSKGQLLLVLTLPELSEVYDKLDIYFTGNTSQLQLEGDPEQVFMKAAFDSEGFTEYMTAVHLAADSYAQDHGLVVTPLAQTSKDNLQFKLTKHSLEHEEGTSFCNLELGGEITYTIPLKSKDGHASGSIVMKCGADIFAVIAVGGQFEDHKSVDLYLTNATVTTLTFEMEFKLDYSQSYEETYLVHKNTGKIHTSTCRIAKNETNSANLEKLTAQQLSERYNGDKDVMKQDECKVCKAVTGLDGTAYAYNKNTGVLHCMNCVYVTNMKDCNLYTLHPANTFSFTNCEHCRPQDRQVKDFDNRMLNAMKGSDWGEQVTALRDRLGDSVGNKKPSQTDPNLTVPFNVLGVLNVEIGVTPVFEFDMKASVRFTITATTVNTYGIRSVGKGFETYHTEYPGTVDYELKFAGEADAKFGIDIVVKAYPVACEEFACIALKGHLGLYGHFTGVFNVEGTVGDDLDAYCAARLEVGLFASVDGYWDILWFDDDFVILSEQRLPLFKWGYDRIYYAFEKEEVEMTVDDGAEFVMLDLSQLTKAKYLDLKTMKEETGTIWLGNQSQLNATVDFKNEDGSPCNFLEFISKNGMIHKKDNAPENFFVVITVNVTPKVRISNLKEFIASEGKNSLYGYSTDPLVIRLKVGDTSTKKLTQIDVKDSNGNLTSQYKYTYDGDLLTEITYQSYGSYAYRESTVLTYDGAGKLSSILSRDLIRGDSGRHYTFNSVGQVTSNSFWEGDGITFEYEYDASGNLIREIETELGYTKITEYHYNQSGVLTSAIVTATTEAVGEIVASDTWTITFTCNYDSQGRLIQVTSKDKTTETTTNYSYEVESIIPTEYDLVGLYGDISTYLILRHDSSYERKSLYLANPKLYMDADGYLAKAVVDGQLSCVFYYDGVAAEPVDDSTPHDSDAWKQAYAEFIIEDDDPDNYLADWVQVSYNLIYLDDDNIPELLIDYGHWKNGCRIVSYQDGKVVHSKVDSGTITYVEKGNTFWISYGRKGVVWDTIYKIENDGIVIVASGEDWFDRNEDGSPNYELRQYYWDGAQVSEEVYKQNIEALVPTDIATVGGIGRAYS